MYSETGACNKQAPAYEYGGAQQQTQGEYPGQDGQMQQPSGQQEPWQSQWDSFQQGPPDMQQQPSEEHQHYYAQQLQQQQVEQPGMNAPWQQQQEQQVASD